MGTSVPLFEIAWDQREISNAVESISRGGYWAKGPFVTDFETKLESYFDVEHAITVNSGTSALVGALIAHDIGPGDEVIVPSFTFIATANAVKLVGADPVFADIERDSLGLNAESVRHAVTDDTAAIVPVHLFGSACRTRDLLRIAEEHDLAVVEDAAEAMGSELGTQKVGAMGDAAALSFCQNKVVVTGEGGAVITDDPDVAREVRLYRSHGRASSDYFDSARSGSYVSLGTNVRMSDLVAGIGCAQLDKIDELIAGRRRAARRLHDGLDGIDSVSPFRGIPDSFHVYQLYTVLLDPEVDRSGLIDTLAERNISSKIYWDTPVHLTEFYRRDRNTTEETLPVTEEVCSRVLSLPIHPNLTDSEIDRIVDGVEAGVRGAT
jgi:perosamine synthetase